jgi:RimJ/RimL family protein N-acetyltransferase
VKGLRQTHRGRQLSDLELLEIQARLGLDEHGLIAGQWGVKIAAAHEGQLLFLGSELPRQLADALQAAFEAAPDDPPVVNLAKCERMLNDANETLCRTSGPGPSYVISSDTRFTSTAELVLSQSRQHETVRRGNPGNWLADEWDKLIDGKLGPWAIAMIDGRVISVCHTPRRMTEDAAECGVWTDPDFRGQGHAAATTAAWASILEPTGRHLFYSAENCSSQRVAARLNLRLIGSIWKLAKPRDSSEYSRHPLSNPDELAGS